MSEGELTKVLMTALLVSAIIWIWRFLSRWDKEEGNPFEFRKLFLNEKGDVDRLIVGWWWAMAVMSWVVVYMTLRGRVTWDILMAFCLLAVAPKSIALFKGGGSSMPFTVTDKPPKVIE